MSFDFDLLDLRRVNRELTFHTFTADDTTNNEHFTRPGATLGNNGSAENLDPFLGTFLNLGIDVNGVADPKFVYLFLKIGAFNGLKNLLAHGGHNQNTKGSKTKRANILTDFGIFGKPKCAT